MNEEVKITISLKWAVQLITIVVTLAGAYYTLRMDINKNIESVGQMEQRLRVIEDSRTAQLEEVNRNMLSKIFGKDNE